MNRSRKLLFASAIFGAAIFGSTDVNAAEVNVGATMSASATVTVTKNADIDFGGLDFDATHVGTVELGPDGNVALGGGSAGLALSGSPNAAEIAVTSVLGTIEITCETTGVIGDGAVDLNITPVVWDVSSAATYATAANTCGGLGVGAVAIDTSVTNNPTAYIGGLLTIGNNVLNGATGGATPFNTTTGGGDPITFRFVYQ